MRLIIVLLLCVLSFSCRHTPIKPNASLISDNNSHKKRDIAIVFVPEKLRIPAHILYQKTDRFSFQKNQLQAPFKLEMTVNPLMRNPSLVARIEKNGKLQRELVAKKNAPTLLSDKKNAWYPTRSKLSLLIPHLAEHEEVVVTTSYEWMDTRWLLPIFLEEYGMVNDTTLTVDVPYGVTMHFKTTKDRSGFDFIPSSIPHEKTLWAEQENHTGLGMRYSWKATNQYSSDRQSDKLQVFLSFERQVQNETEAKFDGWQAIAKYLYERIDRYDMPSQEIQDFAKTQTKNLTTIEQKVSRIFSFLKNDIEKRATSGSYQEQDVQPATRTFARKYGSPFDIAILGKALFSNIDPGISAELIAAADKTINPSISDFLSPALFSSIILVVNTPKKTYYFDPQEAKDNFDQLHPNIQGQQALLLRPKNGSFFSLPFDSADKNTSTYSYQLWINEDGIVLGEYSIDLTGFETKSFKEMSLDPQKSLKSINENSFLSLQTLDIQSGNKDLRLAGQIAPKMLTKNADGSFSLKLDKIIEPIVDTLKNGHKKGYSSISKLSIFISLFDNFVVKNLPQNVNIHLDGVNGRFSVSYSDNQLVIEGIAMISMPLKKEVVEKIDPNLNELILFSEQNIAIQNETLITGVPDGNQKSSSEENF